MITTKKLMLTALLVVAALTIPGHAQAATTVTATIPFNFSLHGQIMPRGAYTFVADGSGPWRTIELRNDRTGQSEMLTAQFEDQAFNGPTSLRFQLHGHTYVLSDISVAGQDIDLHFKPTRAEREMASAAPGHGVTIVASR